MVCFLFSFLSLADVGCDKFLSSKIDVADRSIILSILFNLKHSLEIVMKTISWQVSGDYDMGHDVQKLIKELKNRIKKSKKSQIINSHLDKLEKFLLKYRQLNLFQNALKSSIIFNDKDNKLFKYPENDKVGGITVDINYSILTSKLTKSDVKEIKNDIKEIREILSNVKNIIKD